MGKNLGAIHAPCASESYEAVADAVMHGLVWGLVTSAVMVVLAFIAWLWVLDFLFVRQALGMLR